MDTKELDCLLVEGKDEAGFLLKFTLRGSSPDEMYKKWEQVKALWFPGLTPHQGYKPAPVAPAPAEGGLQGALGNCPKCGAPNKISKQGKKYCSNTCWLK